MGDKKIQVTVNEKVKEAFDNLAFKQGLNSAALARSIIFEYLRNNTDINVDELLNSGK